MATNGFEEPLSVEPAVMRAGDFVSWRRDDLAQTYPPDEYTLSYVGTLEGEAPSRIEITATADMGGFLVSASSDVNGGWEPGAYQWAAFITRKSDAARKPWAVAGLRSSRIWRPERHRTCAATTGACWNRLKRFWKGG